MTSRLLITAGPTHERIDEVRYVANRSSGQMGAALARAARDAGHEVTLLLGPVAREIRTAAEACAAVHAFESTADLEHLLREHFPACDVLIMAAAVADYRPVRPTRGKLPRQGEKLLLELEPTPDLVAACAGGKRSDQRIVAFALEEPAKLHHRAVEKMRAKHVDAIVANPLVTMGSASVSAVVCTPDGRTHAPPAVLLDKNHFAEWLIGWIGDHLG